jgi:ABC-type sugar transport system substrate-binding protein
MGTHELFEHVKRGAGWVAVAATIGGAAVGVAGCGSSGDAGASATAPSGGAKSASSAAYVAQAKKISADAQHGLVYAPTDESTPAADLKLMTSWLGPSQTPAVPKGKSIAFVSCGAVICNETVQAGAKIAQAAGFATHLVNINGKADIQNLNQAMSSALALHPTAIVGMCITATQVADKLEQARKAGIVTVSTCDPTPTGGSGQFSAAADYANGLSTELLGWGIVADSGGQANVVAIKDEGFPAVIRKIGNLVKVVQGCSTCKIKTATWQVTDAADSAKAANIITGVINGNPKMNTLVMPYSVGMPSAVQAVASSGRKIKIYADDLDAVNQQTLKAGALAMVSSVDPQLAMYQAIDQVIRGLDKQPYVKAEQLPYLAHLYTKATVPGTGVGAFQPMFDYASVYRKLWRQP